MAKEYIERDAAIKHIRNVAAVIGFENPAVAVDSCVTVLERLSSADVVEVVRCKDCEFSDDGFICNGNGHMREHVTLPHKYCADGERRDNNAAD